MVRVTAIERYPLALISHLLGDVSCGGGEPGMGVSTADAAIRLSAAGEKQESGFVAVQPFLVILGVFEEFGGHENVLHSWTSYSAG